MDRWNGGMLAGVVVLVLLIGGGGRLGGPGTTPQGFPADTAASPLDRLPRKVPAIEFPGAADKQAGFVHQLGQVTEELRDATALGTAGSEIPEEIRSVLAPLRNERIEVIVATLPHPLQTHLALVADRMIEVIQQAIQESGYAFDRALMPWDTREIPELDDVKKRWAEQDLTAGVCQVPGMIMFRAAAAHPAATCAPLYVVVLFVAEKPTTGINRAQFATALQIAGGLTQNQRLFILGPTFSGSLPSLAASLRSSVVPLSRVTVASGTVTNPQSVEEFNGRFEHLNRTSDASAGRRFAEPHINLLAFQYDDGYSMAALRTFARTHWRFEEPRDVAVVSESETAYGTLGSRENEPVAPASKQTAMAEAVKIYFPRGISHLRAAYEQQQKLQPTSDPQLRSPRAVLRGPLADRRSGADTVPTYASQTAISQDAVLMGVIQELRFYRPRLVVVRATDPLDTLFLVRHIRGHYPSARVVTLGAESLLGHEAADPLLHGVLALSTYSVRTAAEYYLRSRSALGIRVFASSDSKGTYNAAAALMACVSNPGKSWCDNAGVSVLRGAFLSEYDASWFAPDGARGTPDLKLDVLGLDGFYPLASLSTKQDVRLHVHPVDTEETAGQSVSTRFSKILLVIAIVGMIVLVTRLWRCSMVFSTSEAPNALAPVPRNRQRHAFIAAVCALVYVLCVLPLWPLLHSHSPVVFLFGAWLILAVAGVAILSKQYSSTAARLLALALAAIVGGAVLWAWAPYTSWMRAFDYRFWRVGSAVSALIPLGFLAAAVLWSCWYRLTGTTLLQTRLPELPDSGDSNNPASLPDSMIGISRTSQRKLERFMLPLMECQRIGVPLLVLFLGIALISGWERIFTTLEPVAFDYALTVVAAVVLWLLTAEVIRMLLVWRETRRLLRALARQPFREGFSKGGLTWRQLSRLTMEQMETLRNDPDFRGPDHALWVAASTRARNCYFGLLRRRAGLPPVATGTPLPVGAEPGAGGYGAAVQAQLVPQEISEEELLAAYGELKTALARTAGWLCRNTQSPETMPAPIDRKQREVVLAQVAGDEKLQFSFKDKASHTREKRDHFICLLYENYIVAVLLRIRTLAVSAVGVFVFFVLAMVTYPFEPRGVIHSILLIMCAALVAAIAVVYAQMYRDETISRMTNTPAGELGGHFWVRMTGLIGLPLISLLAAQFPSIGQFFFSWVEPAMKSLR